MTAVLSVIVGVLLIGGAALILFGIFAFLRWVGSALRSSDEARAGIHSGSAAAAGSGEMTAEEEGNVHSGPYGYSPNTAYPETQYGSLFDPDAEWAHEEEM